MHIIFHLPRTAGLEVKVKQPLILRVAKQPLEWETGAVFEEYPIGTMIRLPITKRFGPFWLFKYHTDVTAKVVAQDAEIVKRKSNGKTIPFFHSVAELYIAPYGKRCLLGVLDKFMMDGFAEVLSVPDCEMHDEDGKKVFTELAVGDSVRAYREDTRIEGKIIAITGLNVYTISDLRDPDWTHYLNVSLRDLLWYKREPNKGQLV